MTHSLSHTFITGVVAICLSAYTFVGCSSPNETRRGKLSDAMEKASKKTDDHTVHTEPVLIPPDTSSHPAAGVQEDITPDSSQMKSSRIWLGLRGGYGTVKATDFETIGEFGVFVGSYFGDRLYGEVWGFLGGSSVETTGTLNKSIKNGVNLYGIGVEGKYFLTPSHTFVGLYLLGGVNFSSMSWEYQNAITVNKYDDYGNAMGTETITSDNLSGIDLFVGLGLHLFQFSGFHVGTEITPGIILWSGKTSEGFDNDIFSSFYYVKLRVHIAIGL